jgi:hypothetical protein
MCGHEQGMYLWGANRFHLTWAFSRLALLDLRARRRPRPPCWLKSFAYPYDFPRFLTSCSS